VTGVLVVGVDGTDGGRRALRWALDQAAGSDRRVRAVWVWQRDDLTTAMGGVAAEQARAEGWLGEQVRAVAGPDPQVPVERLVVAGPVGARLAQAATDADLLIMGTSGRRWRWRALSGSVSAECVRRATVPVVVVGRAAGRPGR